MPEAVGLIGLGHMGKPMALNLLKAGFALTVCNRSRPALEEVTRAGAVPAETPRAVAARSAVVITMLPEGPDVDAVLAGPGGVFEAARAGLLIIDMSTIAPATAVHLAAEAREHGARLLDAPVSGGDAGASAGTLSIMVGGEAADVERARPIFAALGTTITHCGPHGAGQIVKACNQVVVALIIEALSEALVLGAKAGVTPAVILRVLGGGLAQNRVLEVKGPAMIQHQFAPGGRARLHHKDLGIVLALAREHGVVLPLTAVVDQLFGSLIASGRGDLDHSALLTVVEALSGFPIPAGA